MGAQKPLGLGEVKRETPLLHTPFPSMIDGNRWQVKEGRWPVFIDRSRLDSEGGVMHVPLGGAESERKLRLHEQAHVTWTPLVTDEEVRSWGVQERTIDACEDARIIKLMGETNHEWKRVNERSSVLTDQQVSQHRGYFSRLFEKLTGKEQPPESYAPEPSLVEAARLLASSRGYAEQSVFDNLANWMPWAIDAVNDMHLRHVLAKDPPEFSDTVAYAQELERVFSEMEEAMLANASDLRAANMPNQLIPPDDETDEDHVWGEMEIERVALPERLRHNPTKRTRPNDTGAVPRYMHRLVSDQRVFGRKRKEKHFQGTVLIDHSGSMSLSVREVDEILSRWPAVTIATYCGGLDGTMRIVAEKGRRAAREHLSAPDEQGNCVDGPALDWLAKQKGPRIWISDGQVSGRGEDFRPWFNQDAARKVIRGKIKRIGNVRSLLGS